jgi:hypothetical protein
VRLHAQRTRFELNLVGQPDNEGWCEVRVVVDGADGNWSATSRCLLAEGIVRLTQWLQAGADGRGRARFDTLDNEFSFELFDNEPRQLRVYLEWTFRPVWQRSAGSGEFFRDYPMTERTLRDAARSLCEQLRRAIKGSPTAQGG